MIRAIKNMSRYVSLKINRNSKEKEEELGCV
jgi:hypothetical protein